ncbi:hypothetical protein RB195_006899 [Necator americanus]|uniref:RanBP2-type domain-containing protein n=1 Tax=Necator americanus TaxID=51031 RepID=A0ABR1BXA5_NECAM
MEGDASSPSTSSSSDHVQSIKDFNLRKFDKLVKRMGRKLLPKPCDTIFVPSAIPSCSRHMSHSPSAGDSQNLLHNESDRRKSSAPACGLTVDTSGGETAGSGYGWLTASEAPEPYHGVASVVRAQQIALQMVKERIRLTKQQIDACRKDEQLIADFVADALAEEMNVDRTKLSYKKLEEQVKHLEEEIEELRKLSPRVVPPPRPARPNHHLTWFCVRCLEENTTSSYRCRCSFPRPAIDPREAVRCNCAHCTPASADRIFISPTPGDGDWLLPMILSEKSRSSFDYGYPATWIPFPCVLLSRTFLHLPRWIL